jgi:hypothetical protein
VGVYSPRSALSTAAGKRRCTLAILETPRLKLEPPSSAHADALYSIYCQPGVGRFLITCPTTRSDFDRVFERALRFGASHGRG